MRNFTNQQFEIAYKDTILSSDFFEIDSYYNVYKSRYRKTLQSLAELELPTPARIVEVGGGQVALLCQRLFRDDVTVWDVNNKHAGPLVSAGVQFAEFDLLHDDHPPVQDVFDLLVLCEVVEHLPIPLYCILEKALTALKPGGLILITTPNIFRIRNVLRLLVGKDLFCHWDLPERGRFIGHVNEFSASRLRWQAEKAKLEVVSLKHTQMAYRGSSLFASMGKIAALPLTIVPHWRDGLVMLCKR